MGAKELPTDIRIMRAGEYDPDTLRYPVIVQPHAGARLLITDTAAITQSRHHVRAMDPWIAHLATVRKARGVRSDDILALDGLIEIPESRHAPMATDRLAGYKTPRFSAATEFVIQDVVLADDEVPYLQRFEILREIVEVLSKDTKRPVRLSPVYSAADRAQVDSAFSMFVKQGYAGMVIRDPNSWHFHKLGPRHSFQERVDGRNAKGTLIIDGTETTTGWLSVRLADGSLVTAESVVSDSEIRNQWQKLNGRMVDIRCSTLKGASGTPLWSKLVKVHATTGSPEISTCPLG